MRRTNNLIIVSVLFLLLSFWTSSSMAKVKWNSFMGGENCGQPVSIDGDFAAFSDEHTGVLSYYDFKSNTKYDTGLQGANSSLKGGKIAFHSWGWGATEISVYDIATGEVIQTGISTASRRLGNGPGASGRYFTGEHIAFVDITDNHVKYYSLSSGTITDTGQVGSDPTMDGNIIAFVTPTAYDDYGNPRDYYAAFYDISTSKVTLIERIHDYYSGGTIVAGNVIAYTVMGTMPWRFEVKYYLIDSNVIVSTGIQDVTSFSTDGSSIVANPRGQAIVVYDISKGTITDTGLRACSNSDGCWVDISGKIIVYERYEGGTRDGNGNLVYPEEDLNGNGIIRECVAGWSKVNI